LAVINNSRWSLWIALVVSISLLLAGCSTKEEKVAGFIAKGDRRLVENDPVRAILEYKNALQIDPKSGRATLGLGKAYLQQHEYQRAFSAFKSALELDPELDESRVEVAWLLAMGKQGEPALLEIAQVRHPEAFQPKVDIIKARALMTGERYRDAVDTLLQIKDGNQNKEAQALLVLTYQALGAPDKMKEAAARWRELDPADPASYLVLGQYALDHGDKAQALQELQQMLDAGKGEARVALLRAQILERWGFRKEAEAAFDTLPS
jgi:Tfp pilus assembly protein PilF